MKLSKTKSTLGMCSVASIIAVMYINFGDELRLSPAGAEIIGNAEGCRRDPYICPAGVLTVGIGSTDAGGEKIDRKKRYTEKEIADRWKDDIKDAEACVNRFANGAELPQGAFDAAVSITFNVGCGAMKRSTLFKYASQGNITAMCNQFPRWVYADGKKLRGLEIRREKEKALCLSN